jgi:hydrogenase nickel incorporation protein HypA/HybF
MHEISIMESALELALEQLRRAGCENIHCIRLRVGLLSGVEPEALAFAFEALKAGTPAEHSRLEVERLPGLFSCAKCSRQTRLDSMQFQCPECGGLLTLSQAGAELELAQMEIS